MLGSRLRRLTARAGGSAPSERRFTPDTNAIGANALVALLDAAAEQGFPRDLVLAGLSCRERDLGLLSRISWRDLTQAIDNLERAGMTSDDFERAGAHIAKAPLLGVQAFAQFFLRPEHILLVGLKWVGPAIFPVLTSRLVQRGRDLRLELVVPSDFPGSVNYFHICRGTIATVPVSVGQPKAAISANISSHRAVFDVRCAPMVPGSWRLGRILRAITSAPRVIEALTQQEAAIRQAFELTVESQMQFRRMLGALPDAVAVFGNDEILYANPMLARLFGYDRPSELLGRSWSGLLWPEGRPDSAALAGDLGEHKLLGPQGKLTVIELSARQAIHYEGVAAELVVVRDVTERHALHKQLALADRMASLGTLAAGIAHEINNPLALVISNLELAQAERDPDPLLGAASDGAERVRDIVRDLRIFSKPEAEQPVAVDLSEVVASSVQLARGRASPRARLTVDLQSVPKVSGSRGRLGQVLLNLILNALDAMPETREPEANRIVVRLRRTARGAALEVEDNGAGIPADVQSRMFEPFFTTKSSGSGLGLAVAHDIVTSFGGRIDVRTEPGKGTTFRVELCEHAETPAVAPARPRATPAKNARILVADDESTLLSALGSALAADGHSVECVGSGHAAARALKDDGQFDLILCDLMMPDGSGPELYAHVKRERPELSARMVFMTGGAHRPEARSFLATVENRCLEKPFKLEELSRAIAEALAAADGA